MIYIYICVICMIFVIYIVYIHIYIYHTYHIFTHARCTLRRSLKTKSLWYVNIGVCIFPITCNMRVYTCITHMYIPCIYIYTAFMSLYT